MLTLLADSPPHSAPTHHLIIISLLPPSPPLIAMFTLHRLLLLPALFTLLVGGSSDTINNNNLLNAINANDPSTVQEVLKVTSRKQLNKKGNGGQTPLMFAAMSGKDKVVAALLEAGAKYASPLTLFFTHSLTFSALLSVVDVFSPSLKERILALVMT